jgi:hypothetical protein
MLELIPPTLCEPSASFVHHQHLHCIIWNVEPLEPIADAVQFGKRFRGRVERANARFRRAQRMVRNFMIGSRLCRNHVGLVGKMSSAQVARFLYATAVIVLCTVCTPLVAQ